MVVTCCLQQVDDCTHFSIFDDVKIYEFLQSTILQWISTTFDQFFEDVCMEHNVSCMHITVDQIYKLTLSIDRLNGQMLLLTSATRAYAIKGDRIEKHLLVR